LSVITRAIQAEIDGKNAIGLEKVSDEPYGQRMPSQPQEEKKTPAANRMN